MDLVINGESRRLDDVRTLAEVLERLELPRRGGGIAVAVNDQVVPRARWESTHVQPGDRIEVIHAVQGG